MTEQEQKIWNEAWERGFERGKFEMRYAKFIQPLIRYALMGLLVALGIIFGLGAVAFMIVCFADLLIGLIGLFISGSLCGVAWAVFAYFAEEH